MRNINTLDFVFNRALNVANKYRNFEVGTFRKMMSALPQAKDGMLLSEWNSLAEQSKSRFLTGLQESVDKFDSSVNIASERELRRVISETSKLVDTQVAAIKEQVPSFIPPLNPTDRFIFMKFMNDKSFNILQRMKNNTMLVNSRIVPQYGDKFGRVISNTILKVNNGQSLKRAVSTSVRELANNNINVIRYSNGRLVSAKHYVEMSTRTELLNAHLETQEGRMKDYGLDLVQISEHYDCSELCLPFQGGVFSLSGGSEKYGSLDDAITGGLYHINCRHMQFPYVEGISDEPVKIGKKELTKQREVRKQFRNNQNKIFKAQKNIAAKEHLSENVVNNARNTLSNAVKENNILMQENDFLFSNMEVEMLDKVAVDSAGFSEELGVDSGFFQKYDKYDYKTIEKFVNKNIDNPEYSNWKSDLEYIKEEYLNGSSQWATSDMQFSYLKVVHEQKISKLLETPLLNDQLFMTNRQTNYALGTKFSKLEKEQIMSAVQDMYKVNPELEGLFNDFRYYTDLGGDVVGQYINTAEVGFKELETGLNGSILKYNKGGGSRVIRFTSLEKRYGKNLADETISTIKHEMYHGLDNMEFQLERSLKMERLLLDELEQAEKLTASGELDIEMLSEHKSKIENILTDKLYVQTERKSGEIVLSDITERYGNFRISMQGTSEMDKIFFNFGERHYSDATEFKSRFMEYLEENGVENPKVFIEKNFSDYALKNDLEMWAEVQSLMDNPTTANKIEEIVPGIKSWVHEERIEVRKRIQLKLEEFKNHRKRFDAKDFDKRLQAQIKKYEDAFDRKYNAPAAEEEEQFIDFSLWDKQKEIEAAEEAAIETVAPETTTVMPEVFPEVEQAEVEGNIYKTTKSFLKDQEWDYGKLSKEDLEILHNYNETSDINMIRHLHYDPIKDDTIEKIINSEIEYQESRYKFVQSEEFKENIKEIFSKYSDDFDRKEELEKYFIKNNINPQSISNTSAESHHFIYELDNPEEVFKYSESVFRKRVDYTISITKETIEGGNAIQGNYMYLNLEKLKNMDSALDNFAIQKETKAFRAMLDDDIHLFFNDDVGINDFQTELQELFKDFKDYESPLHHRDQDFILNNRKKTEFKKNILRYMNTEPRELLNIADMESAADEMKELASKLGEIQKNFKNRYIGNEFIDKGYHSTSLDDKLLKSKSSWPEFWKTRVNGKKRELEDLIRFEIDIPKGTKGITLDKQMSEAVKNAGVDAEGLPIDTQKELLLQRNARFKIKAIEEAPEGSPQQWVIKLEVING